MFYLVAARENVSGESVFLRVIASNTCRQVISKRNVDGALAYRMASLADIQLNVAALVIGISLGGINTEGAGDGVTAEQEALGATEDFDSVDVVKACYRTAVSAFIEIILEEASGGVAAYAKVLIAHTADRDSVDVGVL